MKRARVRVCAFYSKGRGYLDVLRRVRASYPGTELTAMAPPNYVMSHQETAAADVVEVTGQPAYSVRSPLAFIRLIRQIRANRYDTFVITFDSTRLRILAALSGAARCAYCSLDGRIVPIRPTVPGAVAGAAVRNLWGRVAYAWVWTLVRVTSVNPPR